ncbi:helix-turn-helix domain-containing protein [Haloplanus natans]|uniref:helix-turn-helix domain-containing protein n=1 Tax=Haloplanus natans TaxID=376171 RepID=UPI000677E042|nr:helix-turn-helix domain-containing protein [Haloplanus natans]
MGEERRRSDKGTYTEEVTPDDALAVFIDHEPRTASEVAEELGIVRRTAYNKLTALEERGDLKRKKVGGRAVVWWRPDPPDE